jgi:prepilin-type N-terminal cleavage/methylation domain-containing protein
MRSVKKVAFTLIELLVVVAIIALLLSILLPSLSGAREQGKKAKCLANLRNLGSSMYQYANDDKAEQIIPIHMNMVNMGDRNGSPHVPHWCGRTANWFCWGGRSGQKVFKWTADSGYGLADVLPSDAGTIDCEMRVEYAADRRPLNLYMVSGVSSGDQKKMEWFQCPGDTGYPEDPRIDDSPPANALRPCYDTLGNSYRASMASFGFGAGLSDAGGSFAFGPWGHRLSSLQDNGKTILAGEPTFFNMIGVDDASLGDTGLEVSVYGWHKRKMMDDLLFCDGSARLTKAEAKQPISQELADQVDGDILHRGSTFKLDVFPVGGAIIWGDWSQQIANAADKWPWRGLQDNLK